MKASEYEIVMKSFEEAIFHYLKDPADLPSARSYFIKKLFENGIKVRTDATLQDVAKFLMEDWRSYTDIQDRYGISKNTINYWINKLRMIVPKLGGRVEVKKNKRRFMYRIVGLKGDKDEIKALQSL